MNKFLPVNPVFYEKIFPKNISKKEKPTCLIRTQLFEKIPYHQQGKVEKKKLTNISRKENQKKQLDTSK